MSFNPIVIIAKTEKPVWYKTTARFAQAETRIAVRQLITTLVPYLLLIALMVQTVRQGYPYGITFCPWRGSDRPVCPHLYLFP
jgi:acyl-lipid omega-6 desaturase (Delta-12 desaturase)